MPGVRDCSVTHKDGSLSVICQETSNNGFSPVSGSAQYLAELEDLDLGLATQLTASQPTFHIASVRPGAAFNLSIYRSELSPHCNALSALNTLIIVVLILRAPRTKGWCSLKM